MPTPPEFLSRGFQPRRRRPASDPFRATPPTPLRSSRVAPPRGRSPVSPTWHPSPLAPPRPTSPRTPPHLLSRSPPRDLDVPHAHPLAHLSIPRPAPRAPPPGSAENPIDLDAPIDVDSTPPPPPPPHRARPREKPVLAWVIRERHAAALEKDASVRAALQAPRDASPRSLDSPPVRVVEDVHPTEATGSRSPARRMTMPRPGRRGGHSPPVRQVGDGRWDSRGWQNVGSPRRGSCMAPLSVPEQLMQIVPAPVKTLFELGFTAGVNVERHGLPGHDIIAALSAYCRDFRQMEEGRHAERRGEAHEKVVRSPQGVVRDRAMNGVSQQLQRPPDQATSTAPLGGASHAEGGQGARSGVVGSTSSTIADRRNYKSYGPTVAAREKSISSDPLARPGVQPSHSRPGHQSPVSRPLDQRIDQPSSRHPAPSMAFVSAQPAMLKIPRNPPTKLTGEAAFAARGRKRPVGNLASVFTAASTSESALPDKAAKRQKLTSARDSVKAVPGREVQAPSSQTGTETRNSVQEGEVQNGAPHRTEGAMDDLHELQLRQTMPYLHLYGLQLMDRDEHTGEPTWLMCRFCHAFGSTGKQRSYLKLYDPPFRNGSFEGHLKKEHREKWEAYKSTDEEEKKAFFQGTDMPSQEDVESRLEQMKFNRAKEAMAKARVLKEKGEEAAPGALQKNSAKKASGPPQNCFGRTLTNDEIQSPHVRDPKLHLSDYGVLDERIETLTPSIKRNRRMSFRPIALLPRTVNNIDVKVSELVLRGELQLHYHERPSETEKGLAPKTGTDAGEVICHDVMSWGERTPYKNMVWNIVLFHLISGLSPRAVSGVVEMMLEEAQDSDKSKGNSSENRSLVAASFNVVCGIGLNGLKRILAQKNVCWGFSLAVRACEALAHNALEVLVVFRGAKNILHRIHLVTVQNAKGAGQAVQKLLDCVCPDWTTRLFGISSELERKHDDEKLIERKILDSLHTRQQLQSTFEYVTDTSEAEETIFPRGLCQLSESAFDGLLAKNMARLEHRFTGNEIAQMKRERVSLAATPQPPIASRHIMQFRESWFLTNRKAPLLEELSLARSTLWLQDPQREVETAESGVGATNCSYAGRSNGTEEDSDPDRPCVDADAERIFWSRALLQLAKIPCEPKETG